MHKIILELEPVEAHSALHHLQSREPNINKATERVIRKLKEAIKEQEPLFNVAHLGQKVESVIVATVE